MTNVQIHSSFLVCLQNIKERDYSPKLTFIALPFQAINWQNVVARHVKAHRWYSENFYKFNMNITYVFEN
jgi:hypothetical protein